MDFSTSWDGDWPGLDFGIDNPSTTQPDLMVNTSPDIMALFNSTAFQPDPTQPSSSGPLDAFELGPPSHPAPLAPPQPAQSPTSPPKLDSDLHLDTPPHSSHRVDTPTSKSGSAPRPKRWTPEETTHLSGLLLGRNAGDLKPGEWDQVALELGTTRTGTAVKGKWNKMREDVKGKVKAVKGKGSGVGGQSQAGGKLVADHSAYRETRLSSIPHFCSRDSAPATSQARARPSRNQPECYSAGSVDPVPYSSLQTCTGMLTSSIGAAAVASANPDSGATHSPTQDKREFQVGGFDQSLVLIRLSQPCLQFKRL